MIELAIIIGSAIGGLTTIVVSSLVFANEVMKREVIQEERELIDREAVRAAIAEKRRILTAQRKETVVDEKSGKKTGIVISDARKIDRELLALADEEARIPKS